MAPEQPPRDGRRGFNRRALLAAGGIAVAAAAVGVYEHRSSSSPTTTTTPPFGPSRGPVFWNVAATGKLDRGYTQYLDRLQEEMGRSFAGIRVNYWPSPGQPQISPQIDEAYSAGRRWIYQNSKPDPPQDPQGQIQWSSISQGGYNTELEQFFDNVKNDSRWTAQNPFHFSFAHEQNIVWEGGGPPAGSPADYGAAFRQVRNVMDSVGAHVSKGGNMLMCWTPSWHQVYYNNDPSWSGQPYNATNCDPFDAATGDRPYDILGCDVYRLPNNTLPARAIWTPIHDIAVHRGVPFMAGELGLAVNQSNSPEVVSYLRELDALLKGWGGGFAPGKVLALCWTSRVTRKSDDRLNASPEVLAEYKRMANDPFYGASV
jgi:hypothetical protein